MKVPFEYEEPVTFKTCNHNAGAVAAAAIHEGHLKILLAREFFDLPAGEQTLPLLHESCHIRAFTGALKDLYEFNNRLRFRMQNEIQERTQQLGPIEEWLHLRT